MIFDLIYLFVVGPHKSGLEFIVTNNVGSCSNSKRSSMHQPSSILLPFESFSFFLGILCRCNHRRGVHYTIDFTYKAIEEISNKLSSCVIVRNTLDKLRSCVIILRCPLEIDWTCSKPLLRFTVLNRNLESESSGWTDFGSIFCNYWTDNFQICNLMYNVMCE